MLLDEDPAALIAMATQKFKTAPDLASINRIHSSHEALTSFRSAIAREHSQRLAQLARRHQTLASQHSLTLAQHNPTAHAAEILRLDTEKFRVAKQASDLEIEGERLAAELEGVKGVWEECEREGVEGGEGGRTLLEEDEVLLKLKLYRSLGIDLEADPATGEYNKAIIRNSSKGDVHVVNVDRDFSRQFYAKYFWDKI